MLGALLAAAVFAAPGPRLDAQHLPRLPDRGLIRQLHSGIALETLRGRSLGRVVGFHLSGAAGAHGPMLQDGRGRAYVLFQRRIRRVHAMDFRAPRGCALTDSSVRGRLFVCGHSIKTFAGGRAHVLVGAPGKVGHWAWAQFAPRGDTILAQWSAECETPFAFLIVRGRMRPFGGVTIRDAPESDALGWLRDGRAVVHFRVAACGSGYPVPGVYAVPRHGPALLLRRVTDRAASFAMWGG
jgi:hypothetical protein